MAQPHHQNVSLVIIGYLSTGIKIIYQGSASVQLDVSGI